MRLTLYTDYAIRALVMLARQPANLITVGTVAGELNVSHNHLVKVVNELVSAGWVTSVRGKNGGIRLAVRPSDINIAQVIERTEKHPGAAVCLDGKPGSCDKETGCSLKHALQIAHNRFMAALADISIDQLLESPAWWHERLAAEPAPGIKAPGGSDSVVHFQ